MQPATDCKDCELVVGAFKEMLHKALKHLQKVCFEPLSVYQTHVISVNEA